jgi:hypothetical protein
MAGHTPLHTLRDRLRANETETDRERRAVAKLAMGTASLLGAMLDHAEPDVLTQLGLVKQGARDGATIATVTDLYLAVLREGIEALDGRLEVRAVFPDLTVELVGHEPGAEE